MYLTAPMRFLTSSPCECVLVAGLRGGVETEPHLLHCDGLLAGLVQLLNCLGVESQVLLAANEDDGQAGAEVQDFGNPLGARTWLAWGGG